MRPEDQIADIDAEIAFLWQMRCDVKKAMRVAEHKRRERDKRVAERIAEQRRKAGLRNAAGVRGLFFPDPRRFDAVFDALLEHGRITDVRGLTAAERGLLRRMRNRGLLGLTPYGVWVVEHLADIKGFRAELEVTGR